MAESFHPLLWVTRMSGIRKRQKHTRHKCIPLQVVSFPLGQKYVGFVQQQYRIPGFGPDKNATKNLVCFDWVGT